MALRNLNEQADALLSAFVEAVRTVVLLKILSLLEPSEAISLLAQRRLVSSAQSSSEELL